MGRRSVFLMLRTPCRSTSSTQMRFMACTASTAALLGAGKGSEQMFSGIQGKTWPLSPPEFLSVGHPQKYTQWLLNLSSLIRLPRAAEKLSSFLPKAILGLVWVVFM